MKLLYYIIHSFIECPEGNLEYSCHNKKAICNKCGRQYFVFNKFL